MELTHGSLFAGIGGFDKGADQENIKTLWTCELEDFNNKILAQNGNAKQYKDIREMRTPGYVDIITGGFPCQDISLAGTMEGIKGSRSSLWSEMYRICGEVRPQYIIIENSPALTFRGLEQILCDLSQIGYCCEWQCISNKSFGYPHHRERIYIIAYTNSFSEETNFLEYGDFKSIFKQWTPSVNSAIALSKRIYEMPTRTTVRNGDGFRHWTHRVSALGNAVNTTVASYLFWCIKEHKKKGAQ